MGAGHETRAIQLAAWQGTFVRSMSEFGTAPQDAFILAARDDIAWAEHLVFVFPLWLGAAPSLLRAFLEQVARAGFVLGGADGKMEQKLKGKSARLVVTMGMPAFVYRLGFGAHGVEALRHSALGMAGVAPVGVTLLGMIEAGGPAARRRDLEKVAALGRAGR